MKRTISVGLTGHDAQFQLDEEAYERLEGYLDRAARRLQGDPERDEVLGDLERSIGDKLAALVGADRRLATSADIDGVLDEIGSVEIGADPAPGDDDGPPRKRRLQRIREGQQLAGVCTGLAAYAELNVDWVRTFFVLATVFTAGIFGLVYIALAFALPVAASRRA
jgi:phage shock protein C